MLNMGCEAKELAPSLQEHGKSVRSASEKAHPHNG